MANLIATTNQPDFKKNYLRILYYYRDLEISGHVDGLIYHGIADYTQHLYPVRFFLRDNVIPQLWSQSKALEYSQRAIALGCAYGYLDIYNLLWNGFGNDGVLWDGFGGKGNEGNEGKSSINKDKAVLTLLKADEDAVKGTLGSSLLCQKVLNDDRILGKVIESLCEKEYTPGEEVLGKFEDKKEMGLYLSNILIQRGSYNGYTLQIKVSLGPLAGCSYAHKLTHPICIKADEDELAEVDLYLNDLGRVRM